MLDIQNALSLLEKREAREAARMLEQMVDEMPAYATARVLLARSYEAMDDWDRAAAVWHGALQLIPNSPVVLDGLKRAASRSAGRRTKPRREDEAGAEPEPPPDTQRPADTEHLADTQPPAHTEPPADTQPPAHSEPPADTQPPAQRAQDVSLPTHMPPRQHMPPPLSEPLPLHEPPLNESLPLNEPPPLQEPPHDRWSPNEPPPRESSPPRQSSSPSESPSPHASPQRESSSRSDAPPQREAPADLSELQDVADPGTPHYEDLDRLISELESARIVPRPDLENVPSPDLEDDIEDVVSETLARIYASQGQYDEAARVYELLAGQHPEESDEYLQKASRMRSRASDGD